MKWSTNLINRCLYCERSIFSKINIILKRPHNFLRSLSLSKEAINKEYINRIFICEIQNSQFDKIPLKIDYVARIVEIPSTNH